MGKVISHYEIMKSVRRTWGDVKPVTKVFKSKKAYNRRDKSWMKGD
jgi:hypothetical protein